jgi:hypothetical protein
MLLAHGGEYPDIAFVPNAAEGDVRCQLVVTESFSAKVPDNQTAAKMAERGISTDRNSAGVHVAQLRQDFGRQSGRHMLEIS